MTGTNERLIFGLSPKQKAASFKLSYAAAMVDSLKRGEKEGGRLHRRLSDLEERILSVLDEYRIERFHKTDLDKAAKLFDTLDGLINEMYPAR